MPSPPRRSDDPRSTGPDDAPRPSRAPTPVEAAAERLAAAWPTTGGPGADAGVEELLAGHPEIRDNPRAAVRLIYEEVCLRQDEGPEPVDRRDPRPVPPLPRRARILLACHRLLADDRPRRPTSPGSARRLGDVPARWPSWAGGRGPGLPGDPAGLADRPVVLKVHPAGPDEHLSLARLQHPHIVPLYVEPRPPDRGLRVLCMPYLGGADPRPAPRRPPRADAPRPQRTGARHPRGARPARRRRLPASSRPDGPGRGLPGAATYAEAVCWIGACLAEALQHAHERGLVHLDIKPSNVLLAGRRPADAPGLPPGPQADRPRRPRPRLDRRDAQLHVARAAPAMAAIRAGPAGPRRPSTAGPTSTRWAWCSTRPWAGPGPAPPARAARRALRRANPRGLVRAGRHRRASAWAPTPATATPTPRRWPTDLRRHLDDLPLRGVAEPEPGRALAEVAAAAALTRWAGSRWPWVVATAAAVFTSFDAAWAPGPSPQPWPGSPPTRPSGPRNAGRLAGRSPGTPGRGRPEPPARALGRPGAWPSPCRTSGPTAGRLVNPGRRPAPRGDRTPDPGRPDRRWPSSRSSSKPGPSPGDPAEARRAALGPARRGRRPRDHARTRSNKRKLIEGMTLRRIIPPGKANPMPGRDRPSPDGPSLRARANPPRNRAG